jgi:hypothetical protein
MPHANFSRMAGKRFKKDLSGVSYAKSGAEGGARLSILFNRAE